MATYDPPQPMWKRNVAGVLDFFLAFIVLGHPLTQLSTHAPKPITPGSTSFQLVEVNGWPALLLFALVIAYFIVAGRTGGTIFQRLFGMKRAG